MTEINAEGGKESHFDARARERESSFFVFIGEHEKEEKRADDLSLDLPNLNPTKPSPLPRSAAVSFRKPTATTS